MIKICSGVSEDKIADEGDVARCGESREMYSSETETLSPPS